MKRPAAARSSTPSARAAKRASVGGRKASDSVADKVKLVAKVVDAAEGFPAEVITMLAHALPRCLAVPQDERHFAQSEVLGLTKTVLQAVEARRAEQLEEATTVLTEGQGAQEAGDNKVEQAKNAAAAAAEAAKTAKFQMHEASGADAAAMAARNDALAVVHGVEATWHANAMLREEYETAGEELTELKGGDCDGLDATRRSRATTFLEFAKAHEFEAQLLLSAEKALFMPADTRGSFDNQVLDQCEAEVKKALVPLGEEKAKIEGEMAEHEPIVQQVAEAWETAGAALSRAADHAGTLAAEADAAKAAIKVAVAEAKAAGPEFKLKEAAHAAAGALIDEVREAVAAFEELEARTRASDAAPPPVEAEAGAEAEAAAPPAVEAA